MLFIYRNLGKWNPAPEHNCTPSDLCGEGRSVIQYIYCFIESHRSVIAPYL